MVPADHKSNSANIVLERHMKTYERRAYWVPTAAALGKKGGVTHKPEQAQLDVVETETRIR